MAGGNESCPKESRRIGVLGGSFDPVHKGHVECARAAAEARRLDEVLFVPCAMQPFKPGGPVAPAADRLAMCALALEGEQGMSASDVEVDRGGVSFMIDTVRELASRFGPDAHLEIIMGSDSLERIDEWKDAVDLAKACDVVCVVRPGSKHVRRIAEKARKAGFKVHVAEGELPGISSTDVRNAIAEGGDVSQLLPHGVERYIRSNGLYTEDSDEQAKGDPGGQALSDGFFNARREELKGRVSKKRLKHVDGVVDTCAKLAEAYGVDVREARLAGLLHDWDKGYSDEEIRRRAYELGIAQEIGSFELENMPQVLHGKTAAAALTREFPSIPASVISAIAKHTEAAKEMSPLDMVVYIADAIEPSRDYEEADALRGLVGEVPLGELYFQIYKYWTLALLECDRAVHPQTLSIWNELVKGRKSKKGRPSRKGHKG